MKPIALTMQAFGSYGEKTTIDFSAPTQNLFLITGDTGAGKTTIFDALVYALYGKNSSMSNEKENLELQSQFASREVTPYVEFTFSETQGGMENIYKIYREPRHYRKKKRGSGDLATAKEVITLTLPGGEDFLGNNNEINEKIQEIMGLTREQFMQVGMIAQGEFMQLLRNDSGTKRAIFRKLFGTEIFEQLMEELKKRHGAMQEELNLLLEKCRGRVEDLRLPENLPEESPLPTLAARLLDKKNKPNIVDLENLAKSLLELVAEERAQLEGLTKEWTAASAQRDQGHARLAKAQELKKSYLQLEEVQAREKEAAAREKEQQENSKLAKDITAAYEIKALFDRLQDKEKLIENTQKQKEDQENALPGLEKALATAQAAEQAAQKKANESLSAYTAIKTKIEAALRQLEELEKAQGELASGQQQQTKAQKKLATAQEAQRNQAAQIDAWQKEVQTLSPAREKLTHAQEQLKTVDRWGKAYTGLTGLKKELEEAAGKTQLAQKEYQTSNAAYLEKNEFYLRAQQHFLDAQAGMLAQGLKEGVPCPVCGSLEHPHPHILEEGEKPLERQELEALAREARELNDQQAQAATKAGQAKTNQENLQKQFDSQLTELVQSLKTIAKLEITGDPLVSIKNQLEKWQAQIEAALEKYQAASLKLDTLQENLAQSGAQTAKLQEAFDKANTDFLEAQGKVKLWQGKIETLKSQQSYPNRKTAEAELARSEADKNSAYETQEEAQLSTQESQSALQKTRALLDDCRQKLPGLTEEKNLLTKDYEALCRKKLLTPAQWQELAELYPRERAGELAEAYEKYQKDRQNLQGRRESLLAATEGQPRPDLKKMAEAQQAIDALWQELNTQQQRIREELGSNERVSSYLEKNLAAREGKLSAATTLESLFKRLSGKNSREHMDIETFVQRHYLAAILRAANLRFREMSAGQFELRLMPIEDAGQGKNRGLDLRVYSTVTGKERDIRTLSGGESFMAALSLALGLSDQIQANTSAINLDIMFIDEGFGSLDDHARGQAIRVLKRLSGGDKLIGIISHVTELKQEMDSQLLVTKDEHGSHVRWQIS